MNKLKFLKTFESFTEIEYKKLKELNKTYVVKKFKNNIERTDYYGEFVNKLRNYDVNKFTYNEYPYGIYIRPDKDFFDIVKGINTYIKTKMPLDFDFTFSIDKTHLNLIDFTEGIYKPLREFGLGYKLYKLIINKFNYITSNKYSTLDAYNIWYNLMLDKDLYCYTSNRDSGVIHKKTSNEIIKYVLDQIRDKDIEFDSELTEKIIELYGSMDSYKQRN